MLGSIIRCMEKALILKSLMLLSLLLLSGFEPTICQFIFKYKFDLPLSEKLRIFWQKISFY